MSDFEIQIFTPTSLLIKNKNKIGEQTTQKILQLDELLHANFQTEILETVSGYNELAIYLHYGEDAGQFKKQITECIERVEKDIFSFNAQEVLKIPVCYENPYNQDLSFVAKYAGLKEKEVVDRHTANTYLVNFIGFLPGFPYLSGLDPKIACPRKEKARRKIEAGSVGIAQEQTGIYPMNSPGGWQIIGRSPIQLFDVTKEQPNLLKPGDRIRFVPINKIQHDGMQNRKEQMTRMDLVNVDLW